MSAIFSDRLRQLGTVTPNPSATLGLDPIAAAYSGQRRRPENATLSVIEARRRLQQHQAAERAGGATGDGHGGGSSTPDSGREFLPVSTLREILELRMQGTSDTAIEQRLQLKAGVVARLGRPGLVEAT